MDRFTVLLSTLLVFTLILFCDKSENNVEVDANLNYISHYDISNHSQGLTEPSGLALALDGNGLWTVSDNTGKIFFLNLQGQMLPQTFDVPVTDMEGITLHPDGEFLFVVQEGNNEIIKINIAEARISERKMLSQMIGYQNIAVYFDNSPPNKGLEGIAWHNNDSTIFVVKEGVPGMLIQVSPDLNTILHHVRLSEENGFSDAGAGSDLDFSGICFDEQRQLFWIVSDKGERAFQYDLEQNRVIKSASLDYENGGDPQVVKKAEGAALNQNADQLFVVSDKEVRLYSFEIP